MVAKRKKLCMFVYKECVMDDLIGDIFSVKRHQPDPMAGDLLVAAPFIGGGCFNHALVCIIEHSADSGTMGLVVNKESGYTLGELVEGIDVNEEVPVFVGGPVHDDRLYYMHTLGSAIPDSVEVADGLYVGGDFEAVKSYVAAGCPVAGCMRFFVGYSGWTSGQLRQELDNRDWVVAKMLDVGEVLVANGEVAWRTQVSMLGEDYRLWLNCPVNVRLN